MRHRRRAQPRPRRSRTLASASYLPDPSGFMSAGINKALAYINDNLTEPFSEADLAAIAGRSRRRLLAQLPPPYRHGARAVRQPAAHQPRLPAPDERRGGCRSPTSASRSGFNNLSNFNRQFLAQKGMPPSRFRALLAENVSAAARRLRSRKEPARPTTEHQATAMPAATGRARLKAARPADEQTEETINDEDP